MSDPENRKSPFFQKIIAKRPFKLAIVFVFAILLFLAAAFITRSLYARSRQSTLELVRGNFEKATESVTNETRSYMMTAQSLAEISTEVLKDPDLKLGLNTRLASYLMKVVRSKEEIDLFYFGNEQGEFLQSAIFEDVIYTKHIRRTPGRVETVFHYFDDNGNLLREEIVTDDMYDPRVRPWYVGAKKSGATYWTEPYIFHENKKPGITVACPVYHKDGSLKGVVAADITLGGLSDFLQEIDIGANGLAFILDAAGQLVAYPEAERMISVEEGDMRRMRPQELGIPRVTQAVGEYEEHQDKSFTYEVEGERMLAYFAAFPPAFGKKWTIAILAPEVDFLGRYFDWVLTLEIVIPIVLVGAFILILFARWNRALTREVVDRQLAEEALRESEGRFRGYFEGSQIGMAVTSPDKGWIEVNHQLEEMLGYSLEELRQLTWAKLTHPDDLEEDMRQFEKMLTGEVDHYTMDKRFIRKDGNTVYTTLSVACVRNEKGGVINVLASLLDITDSKLAEEELHQKMEDLERFSKMAVGREEKMVQLKEEINGLLRESGQLDKYKIVD
jgi:PAS domain S-box-containing protein